MLLDAERSHLVIIDLQQRLVPAVTEAETVVANTGILVKAAEHLGIPLTVTEQYPKGLGHTVPNLAERLPPSAAILAKTAFSAVAERVIGDHLDALRRLGRNQAVVCGAEAHVCVLQTALDLRTSGHEVAVVADAVASRDPRSASVALSRLAQAGCVVVTAEMVLFEWMERAGTDTFRHLSPLIRERPPRLPPL